MHYGNIVEYSCDSVKNYSLAESMLVNTTLKSIDMTFTQFLESSWYDVNHYPLSKSTPAKIILKKDVSDADVDTPVENLKSLITVAPLTKPSANKVALFSDVDKYLPVDEFERLREHYIHPHVDVIRLTWSVNLADYDYGIGKLLETVLPLTNSFKNNSPDEYTFSINKSIQILKELL